MQYRYNMLCFNTYLDQLVVASKVAGVNLREACSASGVNSSTYYRWIKHETTPSEEASRRVFMKILELGDGQL